MSLSGASEDALRAPLSVMALLAALVAFLAASAVTLGPHAKDVLYAQPIQV